MPGMTRRARPESLLPAAYVLYGCIAVLLLAWITPAYENADEIAHLVRAESVSLGQFFGQRAPDGRPGGVLESAIPKSARPFAPLRTDRAARVSRAMAEAGMAVHWRWPREGIGYANTAIYPPFLYVPQAAAIWVGKASRMTVLDTLGLARISAGFVGVLIGAAALIRAGPAAPYLFALLALPMTFALMASVSQDALMIPLAAFAGAELARARRTGQQDTRQFVVLCCAIAVIAMARPPYLPLAALPLALTCRTMRSRLLGAAGVAAAAIGWSAAASLYTGLVPLTGTDPALQLGGLLHGNPVRLAIGTLAGLGRFYLFSFIGQLGWVDVELPRPYYLAATAQLAGAFLLAAMLTRRPGMAAPLTIVLAVLASAGAVFLIQYLTWTPIGAPAIDGVQGRYFLPLAALLAGLVPGRMLLPEAGRLRQTATVALALFPALSIAVAARALIWRYYVG